MSSVLTLARTGLFFLCMAGWWLWLNHRWALPLALAPVITFCSAGCILYLAALLNVLWPVQLLLLVGGLGLLAWELFRHRLAALRPLLCPAMVVYAVACGWTVLLLRGALVQGHDNFAHWAILAKSLITNGQLPNVANTAVEYVDYPPATALWIKFVCNTIGFSDGTMLMAQGFLALACALAMGALCKTAAQGVAAAGFCLMVFALNSVYGTLMVDGLLTLLALAALAAALWQRRAGQPGQAALLAAPVLGFLAITKNSGVFLALLTGAAILALNRQAGTRLRGVLAIWGAPALLWYLWGQHVRLVYPAGMESKHAVDAAAYWNNLTGKTSEELAQFWQAFTAYWLNLRYWENIVYWGAPVLTLILVLALWRAGRLRGRQAAALAAGIVGSLVLYTGGLAATYIFSMPTAEMLVLASIGRYSLTFSLLVLGCGLLIALYTAPAGGRRAARWLPSAAFTLACLALALVWGDTPPLYSRAYHQHSEQQRWLDLKAQYALPEGARYLFYTNGAPVDGWGDRFVARYVFNSDTLDFWQYEYDAPDLDTICYGYDYIVFLGPDEKSDRLLTDWGFDADTAYLETVLFSARQDEYLQSGVPLPEGALTH